MLDHDVDAAGTSFAELEGESTGVDGRQDPPVDTAGPYLKVTRRRRPGCRSRFNRPFLLTYPARSFRTYFREKMYNG
jgi:hypothetical protein